MNYSPFGYNPYTPNYNPYSPQMPFNQSPNQMMQSQPAQTTQSTGPDWIMASTVKQVEQIGVQPGQKAWIMVQNEPVFALRAADNMGLVTTDYYRFEKIEPGAVDPVPDYITRREFEAFVASLKGDKE